MGWPAGGRATPAALALRVARAPRGAHGQLLGCHRAARNHRVQLPCRERRVRAGTWHRAGGAARGCSTQQAHALRLCAADRQGQGHAALQVGSGAPTVGGVAGFADRAWGSALAPECGCTIGTLSVASKPVLGLGPVLPITAHNVKALFLCNALVGVTVELFPPQWLPGAMFFP